MIEFEYADSLKQDFTVQGEFYRLSRRDEEPLICRRRVEIIHNAALPSQAPDVVAVLMNPGSIRLQNPQATDSFVVIRNAGQWPMRDSQLQPLKPDNTQYQLMRLMRLMGWQTLRLINLSDLCDANSARFARHYQTLNHETTPHSLLHPSRHKELNRLLKAEHLLLAWGSNPVQEADARAFLKRVQRRKPIGLSLEPPWFRFASPYRKDQKLSWLQEIYRMLTQATDNH